MTAYHSIVSGAWNSVAGTLAIDGSTATNKRDVSGLLDLWAHRDTPLLNRVKWGEGSGGTSREWITEHLGWGYLVCSTTIASNATTFAPNTGGTGLTTAEVIKQVQAGTLLYAHISGVSSGTGEVWMTVTGVASATSAIDISFLVTTSEAIAASTKIYIVGHFVNEGSDPFDDTSRLRAVLSNTFSILRKDVKVTGSMANTDMYAVASEPRHQLAMRLLEMQFERERSILYSYTQTRSATNAGQMHGVAGFLNGSTASDWVDNTTTTLTESTFNDMAATCWENGGTPNVFVGNKKQIRLFTDWDDSKIRTKQDARVGGHWITSYLTDIGLEVDLIPLRYAPMNYGFLLDTNLMTLVPKKNRKLIVEKLAHVGDYDRWQLLSEYTLELRKYDMGSHGMFLELT